MDGVGGSGSFAARISGGGGIVAMDARNLKLGILIRPVREMVSC